MGKATAHAVLIENAAQEGEQRACRGIQAYCQADMASRMGAPCTGWSCMSLGKQCNSKTRLRVLTSVTGDRLWGTSGRTSFLLWALRTSTLPAKGLGQQPLLLGDSLAPILGLASPAP